MKILHVVPYCYPAYAYGGPPKAVFELAQRQAKAGNEVTVLTTTAYESNKELPAGEVTENGVHIIRVKNVSNTIMWRFHFSTPLIDVLFFRRQHFDVIHLHEVRTLLNLLTLVLAKASTKMVISPWGTLPHSDNLVLFKKALDFFLMPLLHKRVAIGLAQTNHEVKLIKQWGIARTVALVPLAISYSDFANLPKKSTARSLFKLSPRSYVYLFLGRFSPHKGIDLLIKSFSTVAAQVPTAQLLLVGRDDNYQTQMETLIQQSPYADKIIVSQPLYGTDRLNAYMAADAFVFAPSAYEETGTVCLEALACGVPVITTKQAEVPLMEVADGVIHSKRTEKQLAQQMVTLYQRKQIVNKSKVKKVFDWDAVAQTILDLYKR